MQFKIFTIPVADDGSAIEEMNRFLRDHKVLEAERIRSKRIPVKYSYLIQ